MMKITLNGREKTLENAKILAELVQQKNLSQAGIAIARNGEVVSKANWPRTKIQPGDQIEIIRAVQGG